MKSEILDYEFANDREDAILVIVQDEVVYIVI